MTMPTPDQAHRHATRLIAASRAVVAEPNDMGRRRAVQQTTFNIDFAAAAVVLLADSRLRLLSAVKSAERFIAGFEDDAGQEGLGALLAELRAAHGDDVEAA